MNAFDKLLIGANGTVSTSGNSNADGNFFAVTFLQETAVSSIVENNETGDGVSGITIPAGVTIFGDITSVIITSGAVRCYKR